uniref:bifunctional [glutamate--ammonia ligase]-adenylyl-L-tyrosine phosphorylase/[glutamate--ammonia-ligase] adenylyltransferase n=1 Tax=Orrella sp. TaxID=1921583 RepID=UPI004048B06F
MTNKAFLDPATTWSGALRRRLYADESFAQWLESASQTPVDPAITRLWFEELAGVSPEYASLSTDNCRRVLRQLRERVFYAVMVRDIAGVADLQEVTGAMTTLADIAVEQAYRSVVNELTIVHGVPRESSTGLPQEMIIVGMGKLGGCELNVSSDIDLIMLYGEEGETDGARSISHHEFYGKLTRQMMPIISALDQHGQVFRTDLRLRPDGDSGPLAWSLDAFEQYLFTQGREWERYAWLKGRIMPACAWSNSDSSLTIQHVESMRVPFVYRKYFDFDALAALRDLRQRIRQDWQKRASVRNGLDTERNIKLGDGGIREIEFVVQLTQLIRGGKMPALQQRGLLSALEAQERAGLIPSEVSHDLKSAYQFLRRLEHMLQYREDAQTHLLPDDVDLRHALAAAMGMTAAAFEAALKQNRSRVAAVFRDAFRLAGLTEPSKNSDDIAQENSPAVDGSDPAQMLDSICPPKRSDTESLIEAFGADASDLTKRIDAFLDSHRIRGLNNQSRTRVDELVPLLLQAALATDAPKITALRLLDLIETIAQRSAYLALLVEFPHTLARVAKLMSASPWAAQYVIQHPVVLDSLIDWRSLMEPIDFERIRANLTADLGACLLADGAPDVEQQMNLMRDLQRQVSFQLLAQDIAGVLSVEALADQLSALADLLLELALQWVWPLVLKHASNERPAPKFAIIAYGKLGGKELGYSSDLDLVFLFDDPDENAAETYAKLARRLTSWLSTMTSSGRLYEVDLRLRPDGDAGLLAVPIAAFEQYQTKHAWAWEHQAITRARHVVGDPAVGASFERIRQTVLTLPRVPEDLTKAVREMRIKISQGHPNKSDLFDLKHDAGGMVDLEFVTQYLVLLHARKHPELIPNLGNIALLGRCGELGLIPKALAAQAIQAYRVLRKRQHALRLQGAERARVAAQEMKETRQAVRALWDTVLGT